MPATTTIFLCRHAHPGNPDKVFYGHLDGFGLDALGRRQALGLGDFLRDKPVRGFFVSPLQRARETASLAASRLGRDVPEEIRPDLVEAHFGKYVQGIPQNQVVWRRPGFLVHVLRPGLLPGDESVPQMAARVRSVIDEARSAYGGEASVLVSHADPIKAFWNEHLGRAAFRLHLLPLEKGGFLELTYEGDQLRRLVPHGPIEGVEDAPA